MKTITAAELKTKLNNGEVQLIDVREPAEHRSECIEGSLPMPLGEFSIDKLPSTTTPIVILCASGRRSSEACKKLLKSTPSLEVYSLEGGVNAWQEAGYQLKKSGKEIIPLDRQTQIALGAIIVTGTLLGTFLNPAFYILPGFIGTGLFSAGITGWCGMQKLIAKMPWNK